MVLPLRCTLNSTPKIKWTATQENALSNDHPFNLEGESDEDFVVRTYLQFLWLPDSIMPLKLFVPSLLRVDSVPSPLHTLLRPLLQTARDASRKYKSEVPQILSNGGGAGEIEETMMWYALSYEKADDDLWERTSSIGDGPWEDDEWRKKYLERMERREYQIQILMYFLKLSLPGPALPLNPPEKERQRRKPSMKHGEPEIATEETLEFFLDKLSTWQVTANLEATATPTTSNNGELDWMQIFFEQVVKPQFEKQLPDLCSLMRSKIFITSPFSSSSGPSTPASSRPNSPEIPGPSVPRSSSVVSIASPESHSGRKRSRSLSVSLAQERMERERSATSLQSKKRAFNREVSMSRAFKPRTRTITDEIRPEPKGKMTEIPMTKKLNHEGVLLVEATPPKPKLPRSQSSLFMEEKKRTIGRNLSSQARNSGNLHEQGTNDDEWYPPGTNFGAGISTLGLHQFYAEDKLDTDTVMDSTPTKPCRLR